ncbi:hypothetical protein MKY15_11905 [Sporosarcina sp. FSL K6-1540]|uniref:hypothetical protein n=1 Tax=Sporosarcina sp. FSL K6-1540 TaxID=2921555 RepID=UPI00315B2D65
MNEQYRVVKISYSEELSSESELWFKRFIEKILLDHVAKDDYRLRALNRGACASNKHESSNNQVFPYIVTLAFLTPNCYKVVHITSKPIISKSVYVSSYCGSCGI